MNTSFPCIGGITCIVIEGADARRFAQAQFSGNVDALASGNWQWNAWLTAQGRVRALMHLVDPGDGRLLMVLRGGNADLVHADLARYRLRMRVTLTLQAFTAHAGGPFASGAASLEPDGTVVLGYGERSLRLTRVAGVPDAAAQAGWRLHDIRQGWANLPRNAEPEFLPPALGLGHLGATAFDKGCYPGQEIVARLHHRGGHKYRLCHLHGARPIPVGPVPGSTGGTAVWILDAVAFPEGVDALAVIPITTTFNINILDNLFSVISSFDA